MDDNLIVEGAMERIIGIDRVSEQQGEGTARQGWQHVEWQKRKGRWRLRGHLKVVIGSLEDIWLEVRGR